MDEAEGGRAESRRIGRKPVFKRRVSRANVVDLCVHVKALNGYGRILRGLEPDEECE
jgi:hypothetical protein